MILSSWHLGKLLSVALDAYPAAGNGAPSMIRQTQLGGLCAGLRAREQTGFVTVGPAPASMRAAPRILSIMSKM
jgi:hypothetical protein